MKRVIGYGSTDQYRTIVKNVIHQSHYVGYDEEKDETIMDRNLKCPTISVIASEKIHGTNAAACYNMFDGFWVQSKENIITPEKDNAGCAFAAMQNEAEWMLIIGMLATEHNIDLREKTISVYYEWSGGNIQKNSALTGLGKRSIIFQHFKVSPIEPKKDDQGKEVNAYWLETCTEREGIGGTEIRWLEGAEDGIYNIMNYPTWTFDIDFEDPLMSQNAMIELVEKTIEPCSPIGKEFGIDGNIGEGIVCTFMYKGNLHRFKVKGEKHSASKVKTLKPVDEELENKKRNFVNEHACKAWRLDQMYAETFDTMNGGKGDVKMTGEFLKAVIGDVMKEESDIMVEMGLEPKTVNGIISKVARAWFMEQLDREAGL